MKGCGWFFNGKESIGEEIGCSAEPSPLKATAGCFIFPGGRPKDPTSSKPAAPDSAGSSQGGRRSSLSRGKIHGWAWAFRASPGGRSPEGFRPGLRACKARWRGSHAG